MRLDYLRPDLCQVIYQGCFLGSVLRTAAGYVAVSGGDEPVILGTFARQFEAVRAVERASF